MSATAIQFRKFDKITDLESCLTRIRVRVGELQALMPLFDSQPGEPRPSEREIAQLKESVRRDFQRMVALLDLAGRGKLPSDYREWDEKLDAIDASLERSFTRVKEILAA